ncbi:single-stranded-DNA-specific exonuclease RecJ [Paenibacillus koleovorans]|uniref:single-stranded-DNA-specific exonuclease RecJ n=1 Tax=Paenibacillus koleovorans TaxID=121608 RepID=UPI000FD72587|nr:single-stranded-DNA-specific exonuclease RecJ [Paenibacillus koleovorans]
MLQSRARWSTAACDAQAAERLAERLKLHPAVARLLTARGITTVEEADIFLHGGKDHVHDPFLLEGMSAAVERIRRAIDSGEKIRVYGDYDADGVTSTALMTHLLHRMGADFDTYIPHRMLEGYGLNLKAIDDAKLNGVRLLVTVDTGISAVEQIAYATELGIEVIVTDHHEPPEVLPDAYAILNPKKPGCPYPNKQLAGVGVAWKLAHALTGELPEWLAEFAAIGTVADLMPLLGENRVIVKLGLGRLAGTSRPGLNALFQVSGLEGKEVTSTHLGFALAPRINASGRLQHARDSLRLLTTEDTSEADRLAQELDTLNKERQRLVDEMTEEALEVLAAGADGASPEDKVIVVAREGWNAGVIGIVAAKVLEKFYRPTIVLTIDAETGKAKGSARSIAGYDMHRALTCCEELLEHYGGHQAAAGMTLRRELLEPFRRRLIACAEEWLREDDFVPMLQVDAEVALSEVSLESIRQIEQMAPFGMGNPAPRFQLSGLDVQEMRTMGKEKQHLKLLLAQTAMETACSIEAVGFGRGAMTQRISPTSKLDMIAELSINEWNGVRKPQMMIQDMRVAELQVFDWRGEHRLQQKLAELKAAHSEPSGVLRGAVIVERQLHWPKVQLQLEESGWPVYGWDPVHGAVPLNDSAERTAFAAMTDIVLYSLPDEESSLVALLGAASGAERLFPVFADWNTDDFRLPSREAFKKAYGLLLHTGSWPAGELAQLSQFAKKSGLSVGAFRFILDVFEELQFVEQSGSLQRTVAQPKKSELDTAPSYRRRVRRNALEPSLIYSTALELTASLLQRCRTIESSDSSVARDELVEGIR